MSHCWISSIIDHLRQFVHQCPQEKPQLPGQRGGQEEPERGVTGTALPLSGGFATSVQTGVVCFTSGGGGGAFILLGPRIVTRLFHVSGVHEDWRQAVQAPCHVGGEALAATGSASGTVDCVSVTWSLYSSTVAIADRLLGLFGIATVAVPLAGAGAQNAGLILPVALPSSWGLTTCGKEERTLHKNRRVRAREPWEYVARKSRECASFNK